jgi:small subunit ribosomal protein S1
METTNAAPESALQPKARLTGKVIKTTIAGAILDIGRKVPGVVHISQISKDPVNKVEDALKLGQTVDVWVRRVRDDRVELTMVEPLGLEWREMEPGMLVKGKVERLETYGAFVNIGAERPGLVHVSEMSHDYVKNPAEVLKVGEDVEAKILDVDRRKKQIRLSIKAATPAPVEVLAEVNKSEPRGERSERSAMGGKRGKAKKQEEYVEEQESREPELTAFQIAFAKAQERSGKDIPAKGRKSRSAASKEHEDIFDRTLKNRITDK